MSAGSIRQQPKRKMEDPTVAAKSALKNTTMVSKSGLELCLCADPARSSYIQLDPARSTCIGPKQIQLDPARPSQIQLDPAGLRNNAGEQ